MAARGLSPSGDGPRVVALSARVRRAFLVAMRRAGPGAARLASEQ